MVAEQKDQLTSKATEAKDELIEKAHQMLQPSSSPQQAELRGQEANGPLRSGQPAGDGEPFIFAEPTR